MYSVDGTSVDIAQALFKTYSLHSAFSNDTWGHKSNQIPVTDIALLSFRHFHLDSNFFRTRF